MIDRIEKNEERLDNINKSISKLNEALNEFKSNKDNIISLKEYYGSKNWFNDKELYEKGKITKVKAGVLSEDGIWNTLDEIDDVINIMNNIINEYKNVIK